MRNLAIPQQRDKGKYRDVRGGGYERPNFSSLGEKVMIRQAKTHTLQPLVRTHILRVV